MHWFLGQTRRSQVLGRGCASRHAMNRLHRCCYRLGVRLGPAEVPGKPLEKFFNLFAFHRPFPNLVFTKIGLLIWRIGFGAHR
jgi:hypothetical protein